jgi:hypothetical protein
VRKQIDRTFARLYRFMSGKEVSFIELYERTSSADLESWFNLFAFTNFVAPSVSAHANGASQRQLKDSGHIFLERLSRLDPKPKGVWVIGEAQTCYSLGMLGDLEIPAENIEVMKPHPALYIQQRGRRVLEAICSHHAEGQQPTQLKDQLSHCNGEVLAEISSFIPSSNTIVSLSC